MKYTFKTTRGKRQLLEVVFADEKYMLIGEMLLAERSFLPQMTEALDSVLKQGEGNGQFAGNAFSLFITKETTKITNDINGEETEASTKELCKLTKRYQKQYAKLNR